MADQPFPIPILSTKLHRPRVTPDLVRRQRLHELLDGAHARPLALVSAPAGYGKSMLVSHWAERLEEPCAWLSLDDTDGDRVGFASYFLAAVRTLFPKACPESASMLQASEPVPLETMIASLGNELDSLDTPFVLVLDDYHRIQSSSEVHDLLRKLLDHPPRPLHLVVITRRDPPLGLESLRAADDLTEVRLGDLRFTVPETAALLQSMAGQAMSDEALAIVEGRIEGWAVGLRLVALALSKAEDPAKLLEDLREGTQHAQEYLVRQVIASRSPEMRDWMLRTSVLDRFCASLCNAVCSQEARSREPTFDAEAFVRALQEANLFCISLDARGEWFRYHHLFQDLLQDELGRHLGPQVIAELHARASAWFESEGLIEEAIRHGLEAGDDERAALLVERHRMKALNDDQWYVVERWLSQLPGSTDIERPGLLLAHAWRLALGLVFQPLSELVGRIEPLLEADPAAESLRAELEYFKGFLDYFRGDGSSALEHLRKALPEISFDHHLLLGEAELIFSLANQAEGRSTVAQQFLDQRLADPRAIAPIRRTRLVAARLYVQLLMGNLEGARETNQLLRQGAEETGSDNVLAFSCFFEGLIHFMRDESAAAVPPFQEAVKRRYELEVSGAVDAMAGLALSYGALGRPADAEATLQQLFEYARARADTGSLRIAESCRLRLALASGEPAARFTPGIEPSEPEPMFIFIEIPAVTSCRALLAEGSAKSLETANSQLRKCLELNERLHNARQTIEILPLLALVRQQQEREGDALGLIERAVTLAAPGGWVRPFVEPGPQIADLLRRLSPRVALESDFIRRVLGGLAKAATAPEEVADPAVAASSQALLGPDALTDREQEILALLAERLQNKEIAARLFISSHTVNDHLKHIYQKLAVSNRRQAVTRAAELGILGPQRRTSS